MSYRVNLSDIRGFWEEPYQNCLYKTTAVATRVIVAAAVATTIICLIVFACAPVGTTGALAVQAQYLFIAKWVGIGACGLLAIALIRDLSTAIYAAVRCQQKETFIYLIVFEGLHTISAAVSFGLMSLAINKIFK